MTDVNEFNPVFSFILFYFLFLLLHLSVSHNEILWCHLSELFYHLLFFLFFFFFYKKITSRFVFIYIFFFSLNFLFVFLFFSYFFFFLVQKGNRYRFKIEQTRSRNQIFICFWSFYKFIWVGSRQRTGKKVLRSAEPENER